jgi:hypothetical protein
MTDKEPTPIRKRASLPSPILLPKLSPLDRHLTLRDLGKVLFSIGHYSDSKANMVEMTAQEFEAFMVHVLQEDA